MPDQLPFESFAREIIDVSVSNEMSESFLPYSLSVITARALPDVRDGLKPVQRRILVRHAADMGLRPDRLTASAPRWWATPWALPPPRGQRHLRGPGAHGPAVHPLRHAGRSPRQLRLPRRPACRRPLHRVPAHRGRGRDARASSTRRPSTSGPPTTARAPSPSTCPRGCPTCWSTAPRASPWAWPPTCRPTTCPRCATRSSWC